jgi:hypothetical protein
LIFSDKSPESKESLSVKRKAIALCDGKNIGVELWDGVDFVQVQKFVFVCLVRAELFFRLERKGFLGDKHFEIIKTAYLSSGSMDASLYPICIIRSPKEDTVRSWAFLPTKTKLHGHNGVQFRGGGFHFQVYISSHKKPPEIMVAAAKEKAEFPIFVDYFTNSGAFTSSLNQMVKIAKANRAHKSSFAQKM